MAQYWYDFNEVENLDGFSNRSAAQDFELVEDGGGQALRVTTTTNTRSWALWPTGVEASGSAQVRAYGRQGQHQNFRGAGVAVFIDPELGPGSSTTSMDFSLMARAGASETFVIDGSSVYSVNTVTATDYHFIELTRNGSAAEARWWAGDVGDRPASATSSATSTTDTTEGPCGLYGYQNNGNTYFVKTLAIGTDGDPAPTGPVGGISVEPFALRHNPRTNKVIPVLSSPTVTDIGAACVRPRVTKGF